MLRYKRLLLAALDPDIQHPLSMRDLARKIGLPIPTMHSYVVDDAMPRVENAAKIAAYFGEDLASMFSEDDDDTARLIRTIRRLPTGRRRELLNELR
jgi:transcriptional regulator with XRE-family HTH domain